MSAASTDTVYFGYGSNLWRDQMRQRCPTSTYLGVARLRGYKWIISQRGYANIVELSSTSSPLAAAPTVPAAITTTTTTTTTDDDHHDDDDDHDHDYSHEVWGLVYRLAPTDERRLDHNEGVPDSYTKETVRVDFWPAPASSPSPSSSPPSASATLDPKQKDKKKKKKEKKPQPEEADLLVYIDRLRMREAEPRPEYVHRMNSGIADALREGVPRRYIEHVLRRFIPEDHEFDLVDEAAKRLARWQAREFVDQA